MYQMEGADAGRCGSLASRGLPEAVRLPETTQLLLAARSSALRPMRARVRSSVCWAEASSDSSSLKFDLKGRAELRPAGVARCPSDLSEPTTSTSSGETSGKSAAALSGGRPAKRARAMSSVQVVESASAKFLPTAPESAGVQWHGR